MQALRTAVEQGELAGFSNMPFSYKAHHDAQLLLAQMERASHEYQIAYDRQVTEGKEYGNYVRSARLYVSHFIQVLNMCVIRGEIKSEYKELYHLPADTAAVPDLSTEAALIRWGRYVIDGEHERTKKGGVPIYNPSIAKVSVYYDIFIEAQNSKTILQNNTKRAIDKLDSLHADVDAVILDLWNQIEATFDHLPAEQKRAECKRFGVTYYLRKNEKE